MLSNLLVCWVVFCWPLWVFVSFYLGQCIACPSIYDSWLPLWYLEICPRVHSHFGHCSINLRLPPRGVCNVPCTRLYSRFHCQIFPSLCYLCLYCCCVIKCSCLWYKISTFIYFFNQNVFAFKISFSYKVEIPVFLTSTDII